MLLLHPDSLLVGAPREEFEREYKIRIDPANLNAPSEDLRALAKAEAVAGIYAWTVRPDVRHEDEQVVYVGRTASLARRVSEYLREFQAHSVNDYKLRVFQKVVHRTHRSACFALHFKTESSATLVAAESAAIKRFKPLLNERLVPPSEARVEFKEAFERYYAAGFTRFVAPEGEA